MLSNLQKKKKSSSYRKQTNKNTPQKMQNTREINRCGTLSFSVDRALDCELVGSGLGCKWTGWGGLVPFQIILL